MKFAELKKKIVSGEIKNVYYLTGEDEYLKSSAVRLLKNIIDMPEINSEAYETADGQTVVNALSTMPMLSDYRLVILDSYSDYAALNAYLKNPNTSGILLIKNCIKSNKKSDEAEYKKFLSVAEEIDCAPLTPNMLIGWMGAESKKYSVAVNVDAAELLIDYCKSDMSRISSEFDKLASLRIGGTVTVEDVRELVKPDVDYTVWQLANAISNKDMASAMRAYDSFDEDAKKPEVLFGAIYKHFRKLFFATCTPDEVQYKKLLGVSDKAYYMVKKQAQSFGAVKLKRILTALSEADDDFKSGAIDRSVASVTLIIKTMNEI